MTFDIKCKHCNRFLATTNKSTEIALKCSNSKCKKLETYKIVFLSDHVGKHNTPFDILDIDRDKTEVQKKNVGSKSKITSKE